MEDGEVRHYRARIRYRQPLINAQLIQKGDVLHVVFSERQKGIARGQFVAWYQDDELIGSGVIS
jgi:tRNA-specific 2-thiouridylase